MSRTNVARSSCFAFLLASSLLGCAPEGELEVDDAPVGSLDAALSASASKAAARALGLEDDHACGEAMAGFKPAKETKNRTVFVGHRPWHKWNPCLRDLREAAKRQPATADVYPTLQYQILYILSDSRVKFYGGSAGRGALGAVMNQKGELALGKFDRVVETNDHGLAYSTMDQTDFGGALLEIHKLYASKGKSAEAATQKALGVAALGVVTDTVDKGGLRSVKSCEKNPKLKCSWFHAQTKTSGEDTRQGGTLNKHLYGVRDLYQAGNLLGGLGDTGARDQLHTIALQGMNQMVYSADASRNGDLPTLEDYIPRHAGNPIKNSWLYYGRNILEGKPYFLDENDYKNCNYHLLVLRLLNGNLRYMQAEGMDTSGFTKPQADLDGDSVLGFVLATYDKRLASGLYKDAPTPPGGNFDKCNRDATDELAEENLATIRALL